MDIDEDGRHCIGDAVVAEMSVDGLGLYRSSKSFAAHGKKTQLFIRHDTWASKEFVVHQIRKHVLGKGRFLSWPGKVL